MTTESQTSTPHGNIPACLLVGIVYLTSFCLPVMVTTGGEFHGTMWGLGAFLFGLMPPYTLAWLANPALWLGAFWMVRGNWKNGRLAGIAAVVCASSAMLFPHGRGGQDRLAVGYFIWLASTVLLAGATWRGYELDRLERDGKLTLELLRYFIWMPRALVVIAALPVAWLVFTVSGRMLSVDYFAKSLGEPQDGALEFFLNDPSLAVQLHAADALAHARGHGGDARVNRVFCAGLRSANAAHRVQTLEILRALDWSLPLKPPVITLLKDPDATVRRAAAQLLRDKPFHTSEVNWTDGRNLMLGATNDQDARVSAVAGDLLDTHYAVHKPKPRDPAQDKRDPALAGTWRAEYDEAGRHYVDVVQFDSGGAWTNWQREVWTNSNPRPGFAPVFTANPHYRGTWRIEGNVVHTQESAPARYDGHRRMGTLGAIETNRFTLDRKGTTIEYQRVSTETVDDLTKLLAPTTHY